MNLLILQAFEETPTHMSIKINRLEEGHNSYPLVCRRHTETVSLQRRQICYRGIADLNRLWLSGLGPLVLLLPKI